MGYQLWIYLHLKKKQKANNVFYIARWFQPKELPGYFHARILSPIISIQGRKGDENYAIYTTISCARRQANGLAHIPEKL